MGRLRAILLLRGALAVFLFVVGVVLLTSDSLLFGAIAIAAALVNTGLIVVLARRRHGRGVTRTR